MKRWREREVGEREREGKVEGGRRGGKRGANQKMLGFLRFGLLCLDKRK